MYLINKISMEIIALSVYETWGMLNKEYRMYENIYYDMTALYKTGG